MLSSSALVRPLLRLVLVALALAVVSTAAAPAAAEIKIAVIDLRRAVADTEDGLRMKSRLQELYDVRQSEYETKEKAYATAKAELEKLAKDGKTPQETLQKKYAALEKKAIELQAANVAFRREMQKAESDMMYPILDKLNKLVRQLAAKDGYDVVLSREAVPYFRSDLDVTDRIIKMYNASQAAQEEKPATSKDKPAAKDKPKGPKPKK